MRRLAAILMLLAVTACDPIGAITEASKKGAFVPVGPVSIWSVATKGYTVQMSFEQSGSTLNGQGHLHDFSIYPVGYHEFLVTGTHTGTPPTGAVDLVFTSKTMPVISFTGVQDGDKMIGKLVGGFFGSGADATLTKTVR